jgi:Lectin C-type domain/Peptidase family M23
MMVLSAERRWRIAVVGCFACSVAWSGESLGEEVPAAVSHLEETIRHASPEDKHRVRAEIRRVMEAFLAERNVELQPVALPFREGRWKVTQGNSTVYTHRGRNQFSWDFELVDGDGFRHPLAMGVTRRPRENHSFGQPIYAALAGRVWTQSGAVDGGEKNNIIVIHHADGTRSVYDHVRHSGFEVKTRDIVERGQLIGYVGYTGVSYPHIHFSVRLAALDNWTLPVRFASYYVVDSDLNEFTHVRDGVPTEGQIVAATLKEARTPSVPVSGKIERPEDTVTFRGHGYKYFSHKLDWATAQRVCERLGGHLVTITNRREDRFVARLVPKMGNFDRCWIGLSDADRSGSWRWVTGEKFKYKNWGKGQPDNMGGRQHFGQIGFAGRKEWSDGDGAGVFPFVCEWESLP